MRRPELTPAHGRSLHANQADATRQGLIGGSRFKATRVRIALLIERQPAVLLRIRHDRIDPAGGAALEREVIHAWTPAVMRRPREIRRRCQREIRAARSPRLPLGPFGLKSEAQFPQKPTPLGPRLTEIRDPYFDMMKTRHPASLSGEPRALGDTP